MKLAFLEKFHSRQEIYLTLRRNCDLQHSVLPVLDGTLKPVGSTRPGMLLTP